MNAPFEMSKLATVSAVEISRAKPLLGTIVEIAANGKDEHLVLAAIDSAFGVVETVHALMSYQDENSDVTRINRYAFESAIEVHEHTWRVLRAAQLFSESSHGVFDITIAPHLARMGFLPQHTGLSDHPKSGNWRDILLLPHNRVRLTNHVNIDLSGIAKGYAVDLAIKALTSAGMISGRVNAGGDLRVFGTHSQPIHVRNPAVHTQTISLLELGNGAAATSAGYYSARQYQGRWLTPIIHPHRGAACESGRSVTVLAKDCMTADALTKVVYANPRAAMEILKSYKARALIVEHDPIANNCLVFDSNQTGK